MPSFDFSTPAVQAHLSMVQGVIQRMAENSRACKLWGVTTVSAVLFLAARTGTPWYTLIALLPLGLFFLLDVYYLSLERRFRGSYETYLAKLKNAAYGPDDCYETVPDAFATGPLVKCLLSPSVCLYYPLALLTTIAVFIVQLCVN